ncbi:MAG: ribonuclease H-like domain-containing protein [Lachnospiraceae bacterium]|nr:ribonuclease H-like domain-containing protein [Lachnospiraceae bacterium]
MKRFDSTYSLQEFNIDPDLPLPLPDTERVLFLDIETTGLSKEASKLYLIGVACVTDDCFKTVQWFADDPREERLLLEAFVSFMQSFDTILTFNGDRFDLPFLKYRAEARGFPISFDSFRSLDIYKELRPLKKLLGLQSLKQREVEGLLGKKSDDPFTGRDLIHVYYEYVREPSEEKLKNLLYHNSEDLLGLLKILPALGYRDIIDIDPVYSDHKINTYRSYDGIEKNELLIELSHSIHIPVAFRSLNNGIFLYFGGENTLSVRIPLVNAEFKHFFKDYRNYYYLPLEDFCIHKNAASGVPKENRERAGKETCYIKKSGLFLQNFPGLSDMTMFKENYTSKEEYLSLEELIQKKALCTYVKALIISFIK